MRIGLVGGIDRNEPVYRNIAERGGHSLTFHSGRIGGRGSDALALLARSVDFLIVVTDVNSHGAVHIARRAARHYGVPLVLRRRCSPARLAALVAGMSLAGGGPS
jgi:hypothetical protein